MVFSHGAWASRDWAPLVGGDLAVQMFFIISGFYMSLVLSDRYAGRTAAFCRARILRLAPCCDVVLAFTLLVVVPRPTSWRSLAQSDPLTVVYAAATDLTVIGLDGLRFVSDIGGAGLRPYRLILDPPAWSLGLELAFYLFAPLLVRLPTAGLVAVAGLSIAARAGFHTLVGAFDPWTYRFFPFEPSMFVAGMLGHRLYAAGAAVSRSRLPVVALAVVIAVFPWLPRTIVGGFDPTASVLLIPAAPAIPALFRLTEKNHVDREIGEISCPVYPVHVPPAMATGRVPLHPPALAAASVAVAILLHLFIEKRGRPLLEARRPEPRRRSSVVAETAVDR